MVEKWTPMKALGKANRVIDELMVPPFKTDLSEQPNLEFSNLMNADAKTLEEFLTLYGGYKAYLESRVADIEAAKNAWDRRIITIFQPHLFSRTQAFFREFADALFTTDILIITDIYPAREIPIPGITAELIVNEVINQGHKNVHYVPDLEDLNPVLDNIVKDNDMVLTMGAGSIWRYSEKYANHLKKITTGVRK